MGQSRGPDPERSASDPGIGQFLAELDACTRDWERALAQPLRKGVELATLLERTTAVERRSTSLGYGGVGAHLRLLVQGAMQGADHPTLGSELEIVKAMHGQVREAAGAPAPPGAPVAVAHPPPRAAPPAPAGAGGMTPPPMITHVGERARASVGGAPPPAAAPAPALAPVPAAPAAAAPAPGGALMPPRMLFESQIVGRGQPPQAPAGAAPAPPAAIAPGPVPPQQQAFSAVPAPLSQRPGAAPQGARRGPPNLLVRSLLGLRAPRQGAPQGAPPHAQPSAGPQPMLGLKPREAAPHHAPAPPPLIGGYQGLPSLFRERERESEPPPRARSALPVRPQASKVPNRAGRSRLLRGDESEGRWWVGVLAVVGVGLVVTSIVVGAVLLSRRGQSEATAAASGNQPGQAATAPTSSAGGDTAALPRSRLLTDDERFRSLLGQVHGRGKESGELRALVDEQAAIATQALSPEQCVGPQCAALRDINKLVTGKVTRKVVAHHTHAPDALRSKWLAGLDMPEISVQDDARVQRHFEFYTENSVGRETFQQMLFRCGAFRDSIQSTMIRHGLPAALLAVVFVESGCAPLAKSPMGAEGLWQFIPEAARAYHLRIIPDMVDERHSPQKSTEAAARYLGDLYAKFGSWDLVFAAYNMGPFGLATRMSQVEGEGVGFWDLVDAELLPDETADYAPTIEAIALILNNLQRLKFAGVQMRAPEVTLDLEVPPATRMSLIARAAAMSLNDLRRLNLDIKGGVTPSVPNFAVQVPKDSVWQARDMLQELLKSHDDSDECAPATFDWGRQRFTPEMAQSCKRSAGDTPAAVPDTAAVSSSSPPLR